MTPWTNYVSKASFYYEYLYFEQLSRPIFSAGYASSVLQISGGTDEYR